MDASARKKIIIALVIFIVLVIGVIIMAVIKNTTSPSSSKNSPKTTTYTDSYSGETVISTEGKVDERYKAEGSSITFLGASKLLEYGVPATHIERLKSVFEKYSLKRVANGESAITQVSVDVATYRQFTSQSSGELGVAFSVILNRDENLRYYTQILSASISQFTILIYDRDQSTVVYDTNVDSFQE